MLTNLMDKICWVKVVSLWLLMALLMVSLPCCLFLLRNTETKGAPEEYIIH
jgi:hypothetical protein